VSETTLKKIYLFIDLIVLYLSSRLGYTSSCQELC